MIQRTTVLRKIASLGLASAMTAVLLTGTSINPAVASGIIKTAATVASKQVTANLNMRTGASTSYKIITVLKKGTKVSVIATSGSWSKVVYGKKTGWVSSPYLKTVKATSQVPVVGAGINKVFSAAGVTSKFHVYTVPSSRLKGILFYLDGDGQWGFDHPTSAYSMAGSSGIVAQAAKRGYMTVAVKTPDNQGVATWWEDGAKNAAYFEALRIQMLKQYPAAKLSWLTGYSGGAQFLTQSYLPLYPGAARAGGGALMMGGGGAPELKVKGFTKAQAAAFEMHWFTGAADIAANSDENYDALGEAKAGKAWYAKAGFPTFSHYPAGVDHDLTGRFGNAIGAAMDR